MGEKKAPPLESLMDCPVCRSQMVCPRLYECGHSVCEFCMLQSDVVAAEEAPLNTLPVYRCPECRAGTLLPTGERPVNHSLSRLLQLEEGYAEREAQVAKETQEWFEEEGGAPEGGGEEGKEEEAPAGAPPENLALLSGGVRQRRAQTLFRRLLPSLRGAALRGASRLVVTTRARELAEMGKEIATMLFPYGIHSVVAHAREFCVNILREEGRYSWGSGEFVNEEYRDPPRLEAHRASLERPGEEDN